MSIIPPNSAVRDTRADPRWRPLEVSCQLVTPALYYGDGLNLDGPLAYAAFRALDEDTRAQLGPPDGSWNEDFRLPVATWTAPLDGGQQVDPRLCNDQGDLWGWCTSDVVATWEGRQPYAVRGPTAHDRMRRMTDDPAVNTSSGRFKPYDLRYEGWWPTGGRLTWYALGDAAAISESLLGVTSLGKRHCTGFGKIDCDLGGSPIWSIKEIDHDLSLDHRPMPYGWREGALDIGPIRAPNRHRSRYAARVR